MSEPPLPTRRRADATRWDIQGLRAFAVLAVVLYHLWPNRLPGGFVGVDVFFVISGFLITGHLLREQTATGRIALGRFWSRRAKRLLPGAFLTLLASGAAVLLVVPSTLWGQYGRELIASTVYVQNWQLASDSVDYLASDNRPSPFQHFWSLSVEEQFYIALPLLLALLGLLVRRTRWHSPVRTARVLLGAVVVLSLVWCVVETRTEPGVAYFSTATRAWEFALGGLASTVVLTGSGRSVAGRFRTGGAWLGVVLLLASLVVITPATAFPGIAALLPVAGATLVVLLGARSGLQVLGRWAPVAFVGRISYAVYLWHWPAVVLVPMWTGHPLGTRDKLAILVASLVVASVTTLFVEEPLRFSRRFRELRPRRVALLGLVATVCVVALGGSTLAALQVQQTQAQDAARALARGDVPCFGAAAQISSADPCVNPDLADVRVPAPAAAVDDDANRASCWTTTTDAFNMCTLGPRTGYRKHLAAIGDSHNNTLISAYQRIAEEYHWRIDVAGHSGCYLTTAVQVSYAQDALASCTQWKQKALDYVRDNPDLDGLIVTHSTGNTPVVTPPGQTLEETTVDGMVGAWQVARDAHVPIIAIRDNPLPRADVIDCVGAMQGPTTAACDSPRSSATSAFDGSAEALERVGGGRLIDLTDLYCTATTCPAVVGGVLVYRDRTHVTETWATSMAPYLGRDLRRALDELDG